MRRLLEDELPAADLRRVTLPGGVLFETNKAALLGTAAVLATYWLGKRFFDRRTGLGAAVILAVSPLHVSHSHIAITDVPHALLICLASIACLDVLTKGRTKHYALAGLLIGLGTATKYLAVFNALTLVLQAPAINPAPQNNIVRRNMIPSSRVQFASPRRAAA